MAALPCTYFIPMLVQGQLFCARCGLHNDFHRTQVVVISDDEENMNNHHHHQQQNHGGQAMFPLHWQNQQMEHWVNQPPPYPHAEENTSNPFPYQLPENELSEIRSTAFTPEQLQAMLAMARSLQWTLRGRSRDAAVDQFCLDIDVSRSQFSNWVNRNRARFAGRRGY